MELNQQKNTTTMKNKIPKYTFVEKDDSEVYSLKILDGKYKDVVYTYGVVSIKEAEDQSNATVKFDFRIEESIKHEDLDADKKFKNLIGDILVNIIENQIEDGAKPSSNNSQSSCS
jgi:hypothetical protein